jgi:hypothetical protein
LPDVAGSIGAPIPYDGGAMCCFSRPVKLVADTRIFVRASEGAGQVLVYQMEFEAAEDLAMVLPLPVPPRPAEDAVRFVNLEACPEFFTSMARGFRPRPNPTEAGRSLGGRSQLKTLAVHTFGRFEASFVPEPADFRRLDPRFALPPDAWAQLPRYADHGFAVFKLASKAGRVTVHPMAFEFPRRDPTALFVPAVHIHDGRYRPLARYDHDIYCQPGSAGEVADAGFEVSSGPARAFMKPECMAMIVDGERPCFRQKLRGHFRNTDLVIRRGGDGRPGLRLEGRIDDARWVQGANDLVHALVAEVILDHPEEVDECRRQYPDAGTIGDGSTDWQAHAQLVETARNDLHRRLAKDLDRARAIFEREVPSGLQRADAHFRSGLDDELREALSPSW